MFATIVIGYFITSALFTVLVIGLCKAAKRGDWHTED